MKHRLIIEIDVPGDDRDDLEGARTIRAALGDIQVRSGCYLASGIRGSEIHQWPPGSTFGDITPDAYVTWRWELCGSSRK